MAIERWAEVKGLFLKPAQSKVAESVCALEVTAKGGIDRDVHDGTRGSNGNRERSSYGLAKPKYRIQPKHWREVTLLEVDELDELALRLGIPQADATMMARFLCGNILLKGPKRFTDVPAGSALHFYSGDANGDTVPDCTLVVTAENLPCEAPGHAIKAAFPDFNPKEFEMSAKRLRGQVANVFFTSDNASVSITPGMRVKVWQRGYLDREKPEGKALVTAWIIGTLAKLPYAHLSPYSRPHTFSLPHAAEVLIALLDRFDPVKIASVVSLLMQYDDITRRSHATPLSKRFPLEIISNALLVYPDEISRSAMDCVKGLASITEEICDADLMPVWGQAVRSTLELFMHVEIDAAKVLQDIVLNYNRTMKSI